MGGQGVGSRPGRLDDEHSHAAAGQQHRGGRTGAPAAGDDRVVMVVHQISSVAVEIVGEVSAQVRGVAAAPSIKVDCAGARTACR
jgi:hypothetical protein